MDVPSIPGYDVLGRIGSGGSAEVWRARRVADDLHVALKVVPTGPGRASPALREAGILARVHHQHVIRLYDVVPVPGGGDRPDAVALAMELAEGGSLAEVIGARGHLTPGELVTVVSPLAAALAELHRVGVVHGDVSLGNVLFRADGMPLLTDLGVSRIAGERRAEAYGTDGMVAPEVTEGFDPTAESDVYGLGALAWRCLVGEPPGWVGTRSELGELRPDLAEDLVDLVTACLAGEPADRPEAEEVAATLFASARPEPIALAPGADPAAGLTQRLRADLRETSGDGTPEEESVAAAPRRAVHPRALLRRRPRRPRSVPRWMGVAGALGAITAVAFVVYAVLGVAIGPPVGDRGAAEATATQLAHRAPADSAATSPSPTGPASRQSALETARGTTPERATATTSASPAGPTSPDSRTPTDLAETAQNLLDARAAAWRSGDLADLEAVHLTGSPAYEQDKQDLEVATDLGVSYADLAFSVAAVEVLASGPERAVLGVEVERSTYREVSPSGIRVHQGRTDVVELELRAGDGGWRIWGWG